MRQRLSANEDGYHFYFIKYSFKLEYQNNFQYLLLHQTFYVFNSFAKYQLKIKKIRFLELYMQCLNLKLSSSKSSYFNLSLAKRLT